ncbi:MAG TPA: hypothetical protein ENJ39_03420 [Flammeovirgaceae bacterium]|nr:hypothetical protein [Flammeovirgaceae bacterium]
MDERKNYKVAITPEAERYFFHLLDYLYQTHSATSAARKASEIIQMAESLGHNPHRGSIERRLAFLAKGHRFLLYKVTSRKQVKIIYFVDEPGKTVYITDFFGTMMDDKEVSERNQ